MSDRGFENVDIYSDDVTEDITEDITEDNTPDRTSNKRKHSKKKGRKRKKSAAAVFLHELFVNSIYLLIVMLLTLLFVKYVGQRTVVDGFSMQPQLNNQDNLIVDKISYRFHDPERFDIVVFPFEYNRKGEYYIKRIIGLPGETVQIDYDGNIFINGELLDEHYGAEVIEEPGRAVNPVVLGEDEYFVLGDNRNHSSDSRTVAVGNVKREKLIGRAWVRVYPFDNMGFLHH